MTTEEYVLYILMRTDLPSMNSGKAMAQASHASNAFIHSIRGHLWGGDKTQMKPLNLAACEWTEQTQQGFGTVLVLGCELRDILKIEETFAVGHSLFDKVIDPTYPYIVNHEIKDLICNHSMDPHKLESGDFVCFREEVTCAYLFADKNNEHTKYMVGNLRLHP